MARTPLTHERPRTSAADGEPPGEPLLDLRAPGTVRTCKRILIVFAVLGMGCRVARYVARPSYWNDEAAVVLNVIDRTCGQLVGGLDYAQATPPLFLWAERGLFNCFGPGEYALRSLPLLYSLLTIPLFALLAWRLLPPTSAMWAVAWLAISDHLIPGAAVVKQYGADVMATTVLLWLAIGPRAGNGPPLGRFARASLAAAVLCWLSYPSVFVFAAISLALLPAFLRAGPARLAAYLGCNAVVLASFGLLYLVSIRVPHDPSLDQYWASGFPHWHGLVSWLARQAYALCSYPFFGGGWVVLPLAVAGFAALVARRLGSAGRTLAVTFAITLGASLLAAALRRYPGFGEKRLSLYLLPPLFLLMGAGAEGQLIGLRGRACRWWWVVPVALLGLGVGQTAHHVVDPEDSSQIRPVVAYVRAHHADGEAIYLLGDELEPGTPSGRNIEFLCYWRYPDGPVRVGVPTAAEVAGPPSRRFWAVYSLRRADAAARAHADAVRRIFAPSAREVGAYRLRQAGAILYEAPAAGAAGAE